jgi:hypothetical protein
MQQQQGRIFFISGFTVEDIDSVNCDRFIVNLSIHILLLSTHGAKSQPHIALPLQVFQCLYLLEF